MNKYRFAMTLDAYADVEAESEAAARKLLNKKVDAAMSDFQGIILPRGEIFDVLYPRMDPKDPRRIDQSQVSLEDTEEIEREEVASE